MKLDAHILQHHPLQNTNKPLDSQDELLRRTVSSRFNGNMQIDSNDPLKRLGRNLAFLLISETAIERPLRKEMP